MNSQERGQSVLKEVSACKNSIIHSKDKSQEQKNENPMDFR